MTAIPVKTIMELENGTVLVHKASYLERLHLRDIVLALQHVEKVAFENCVVILRKETTTDLRVQGQQTLHKTYMRQTRYVRMCDAPGHAK